MNPETPGSESTFEDLRVSLSTYSHVDEVPGKFFRKALEIMQTNHVPINEACKIMADTLKTTRETIQAKLMTYSKARSISEYPPRKRDLLRIPRF